MGKERGARSTRGDASAERISTAAIRPKARSQLGHLAR